MTKEEKLRLFVAALDEFFGDDNDEEDEDDTCTNQ